MNTAPPGMWSCPCGYAMPGKYERCVKCGRAAPSEDDVLAREVAIDFASWLCERAPMTEDEREVAGI